VTSEFLTNNNRHRKRDLYTAWWFGTMEIYDFPFSWEFHHPLPDELHHFSEA
jgi:hypothetical protein